MRERWRAIEGHPGYEVSDLGRVRSVDRTVVRLNGTTARYRGRNLKLAMCGSGYLCAQLGRHASELVHRLVAKTFVRGEAPGLQVNHDDGDKLNNHWKNLEWATASTNIKHSYDRLPRKKHSKTIAVVVGGVEYESALAAAKAIGRNPGSVASALHKNHRCAGMEVLHVVPR